MNKEIESGLLDSYFAKETEAREAEDAVHQLFGNKTVCVPLRDYRDKCWVIRDETNDEEGRLIFSNKPLTEEALNVGDFSQISTNDLAFPKNNFTLVLLCDDNGDDKHLGIFDNSKREDDAKKWTAGERAQ